MALRVNGELIADEMLHREYLHVRENAGWNGSEEPAEVIHEQWIYVAEQNLIRRTLLLQIADERQVRITPAEIEAERRRRWGGTTNSICGAGIRQSIEADLLVERVRRELTKYVPRPGRKDVERYYQEHPQEFYQPERILAAHIFRELAVEDRDGSAAQEALIKAGEELTAGKPFAQVADRYSDCRGVGGAIGWIVGGQMVAEFDEVVFALNKNQWSPIFRTVFGLHIACVRDRKPAGVTPLDEVKGDLARSLYEARCQQALHQILNEAIRQSHIVQENSLPSSR